MFKKWSDIINYFRENSIKRILIKLELLCEFIHDYDGRHVLFIAAICVNKFRWVERKLNPDDQ